MIRAPRFAVCALALALPIAVFAPASGCAGKDKGLEKVEVPADGVTLAYQLLPGAQYVGQIERAETSQTGFGQIHRSVRFKAVIEVKSVSENGDIAIKATIKELDLSWKLPPNFPISLTDLIDRSKARLSGATIDITLSKRGDVRDVPELPPELEQEERLAAQAVLDSLVGAFTTIPERRLTAGEQWTETSKRGREGKLGRYMKTDTKTKFEGLFRKSDDGEAGPRLAKLSIESSGVETTTTKSGGHEVRIHGDATIFFDAERGFLAKLEGSERRDDADGATTTTFSSTWSQTQAGSKTVTKQMDAIEDPCDPDYVGTEDCAPEGDAPRDPEDPPPPLGG